LRSKSLNQSPKSGGLLSLLILVFFLLWLRLRSGRGGFFVLNFLEEKVGGGCAAGAALWVADLKFVHDSLDTLGVALVDHESLAKRASHVLEHGGVEVHSRVDTPVRAEEAALERKRVDQIKLFPHDDAATSFFGLLDCETTVLKAKHIRLRLEQQWEEFVLVPVLGLWLVVSEHKGVTPDRVSVHVDVKENFSRLQSAFHHQLRVIVDWVELGRAGDPLPIQVHSHKRASVVSNNDTIWILHGDNLKNKSVSKKFRVLAVPN